MSGGDKNENLDKRERQKQELLYDGELYDVTNFMERHPGGNIMELYTEHKEDATIAVQQFHYRSLPKVMARMRALPKREVSPGDITLGPDTRKRHEKLTADYMELFAEIERDGMMEPEPRHFFLRVVQSLVLFAIGLAIRYWLASTGSLFWRLFSLLIMTVAGGKNLFLGHEGGHNSFTGKPSFDRMFQTFSFGFVYGLSASCWNSTHSEHHAMPQHDTKDADLKTMPLIAFHRNVVRLDEATAKSAFWLHYQHILFVLCDTTLVTFTWKWNHHLKFCWRHGCYLDLLFMTAHYLVFIPLLGLIDWLFINWLASIYVLGNLVLSHTHLPVVKNGQQLHWVEYCLLYTTNIRSSWWVDWWTGLLNYQIEHHLFPTMPEHKCKLIRGKVKAFAARNGLPYLLCSYWEAVKMTYFNLEKVAQEIKKM